MKLNHDLLDNYCNHLHIFLNPSLGVLKKFFLTTKYTKKAQRAQS